MCYLVPCSNNKLAMDIALLRYFIRRKPTIVTISLFVQKKSQSVAYCTVQLRRYRQGET